MTRQRFAIVLALLFAAAGGALALNRRKNPAVTDAGAPVLVVEPGAPKEEPPREGAKERAMALVVASLSPEERARAIEIMSYASARLEARASSIVDDFGDDIDPMVELQKALAPYVPSITAARAFERGRFAGSDFTVTPALSCAAPPVPSASCVAAWKSSVRGAEEPAVAERARFAAWPIAYATVADLGTVAARDRAARSLRAGTVTPNAMHSLVLTAEDLELTPLPGHEELEAAAKRLGIAMDANDLRESTQLEGFAHPAPAGRVARWLTLSKTELLVVPRLSTVARAGELRASITRAAGDSRVVAFRGLAVR